MNVREGLRLWVLALMCACALGCSDEESPNTPPPDDDTSPVAMSFVKNPLPVSVGVRDMVFLANGRAAFLTTQNEVFLATDTNYTFTEVFTATGVLPRCIAMHPSDGRIFVGCNSPNYQFAARFIVLSADGTQVLRQGEAKRSNTGDDIAFDFNQVYWNSGGGVYATMGNNNNFREGCLAVVNTPETSNNTSVYDAPLADEFYPAGFAINSSGATLYLGLAENIDPFNPTIARIFYNTDKFFGSWFNLNGYPVGYPHTIGQQPNGTPSIWMFNAERLFINGTRTLTHTGLPVNGWNSAKVDARGHVWVGTNTGLYVSSAPLPN